MEAAEIESVLGGWPLSACRWHAIASVFPADDERHRLALEACVLSALGSGRLLEAVEGMHMLADLGLPIDALWSQVEAVTLNASGWTPRLPPVGATDLSPTDTELATTLDVSSLNGALERLRGGLRFGVGLERCPLLGELDPLTIVRVLRVVERLERAPGEPALSPPDAIAAWLVGGTLQEGDRALAAKRGALIGPGRAAGGVLAGHGTRILALSAGAWSALAARDDFAEAANRLARRRRLLQVLHDVPRFAALPSTAVRGLLAGALALHLLPGVRMDLRDLGDRVLVVCSGECRLERPEQDRSSPLGVGRVLEAQQATLVAHGETEAVVIAAPPPPPGLEAEPT